jgi:O-antigen/teichoic acid export membrane protein
MSNLRKRIRTGLHFTILNRVAVNGIPAAVVLFAVRLVSTTEFGIFSVLAALSGLVGKATSLGWPEAIARYVPRLDLRNDRHQLVGLVLEAMVWRFVLTGAIAFGMTLAFDWLAPLFKIEGYRGVFVIFACSIVLTTQNFLLTAVLESLLLQRALFSIGIAVGVLQVSFLVGLALRGGTLVGLAWMELTRVAALFILQSVALLRFIELKSWRDLIAARVPFRDARASRYRWLAFVNDIGQELLGTRSDNLLLSYLANNLQVAIYALPVRLIRLVEVVVPVALLKGPLESAFYRAYERKSTAETLNMMFRTLMKANLTVLGLLVALSILFAKPAFVHLFGAAYGASANVFLLFLVFLFLNYYPLGFVLRAIERMDLVLWGKVSVFVNILLAFLLVHRWGAMGMAVATALSAMLRTVVIYLVTTRLVPIHLPWGSILRIVGNIAGTVLLVWPLSGLLSASLAGLVAGVLVTALLYAIMSYFNSGYATWEIKLFGDLLPARVRESRVVSSVLGGLLLRAAAA